MTVPLRIPSTSGPGSSSVVDADEVEREIVGLIVGEASGDTIADPVCVCFVFWFLGLYDET
jgi:hypothetical protein